LHGGGSTGSVVIAPGTYGVRFQWTFSTVCAGSYLRHAYWSPEFLALRNSGVWPPVSIRSTGMSHPTSFQPVPQFPLCTPGTDLVRFHPPHGWLFQVIPFQMPPLAR
jgi:hypothetical protein